MPLKNLIELFVFSPAILFFILAGILWVRLRRRNDFRLAFRVGLFGLILLLLFTSAPLPMLVELPLKSWIPENTDEKADAIVALGSGATESGSPSGTSAERVWVAAQLFLMGRAPLILLTGASGTEAQAGAEAMKILALGLDVPESKILLAPGFTTYEEAVSAKKRLASYGVKKIVLVTNDIHIPRATAVFQKQGFRVVPHGIHNSWFSWFSFFSWGHIPRLRAVCHEYVGLLVYRMRGWIDGVS